MEQLLDEQRKKSGGIGSSDDIAKALQRRMKRWHAFVSTLTSLSSFALLQSRHSDFRSGKGLLWLFDAIARSVSVLMTVTATPISTSSAAGPASSTIADRCVLYLFDHTSQQLITFYKDQPPTTNANATATGTVATDQWHTVRLSKGAASQGIATHRVKRFICTPGPVLALDLTHRYRLRAITHFLVVTPFIATRNQMLMAPPRALPSNRPRY